MKRDRLKALREENEVLRLQLEEARGALDAIRAGEVESLVIEGPNGPRIFSLETAGHSYRALVEAMEEGAATLSEQGIILYCNRRLATLIGEPLERVMGSALRDWIPNRLQSTWSALSAHAKAADCRGELLLRGPNAAEVPVQVSLSAFQDDGRNLLCLVVTDLSDQKRNEQIVAAARLARSVLDQAVDAVVVCDARGRITQANRAAEHLCGCSPLRANFDAALPLVLSSPLLADGVVTTALGGAVTRAEPAAITRADGTVAELLVSAAPLQADGGSIIGCVVTMVDVTESRRGEAELRAANERIRTLGDNLPDGAVYRYAHDASGRGYFVYISAGIEQLTGVSPGEILRNAAALHDLMMPEDRQRLVEAELQSRNTLAPFELEVRQQHRHTCEWRWALLRSVPRRLMDGSTVWDGFHFDITARKKAEDSLRETDRNKTHFLAVLSHELRNPLTPIRNSLYLLERSAPGSDQAQRAQEVIRRQVEQLSRLVDDLLDVTRISRGKMSIERERLEFGEVVRRAIDDHRGTFDENGIALQMEVAKTGFPLKADRGRLVQAVGNLLSNTTKFTPSGGHVWVTLARAPDDNSAILSIRDDGCGIDADMLPRLFEPFSQAPSTVERSRGGLGLGLSLVRGIAEILGGSIAAASDGVGKGTEFALRLPLERLELDTHKVETAPSCASASPRTSAGTEMGG